MKHTFINNQKAEADGLAAILAIIGAVIIAVVYFAIIPMIGSKIDTAADLQGDYATGTLTFSGNTSDSEVINISTDRYEFDTEGNYTSGNFVIDVSGGNNNSSRSCTLFAADVALNDTTGIGASCSGAVVTLTADAVGAAGNVALTTNGTNITASGATLTGGVDADANWVSNDIATGADLWGDVGSMIGIAFIIAIVAVILFILRRDFE